MSETKWTAAQQAAIDDRGGALLVSAAAGSGKTAVLTERAVRLITDPECPIDADKLLIVTFTNAAAAELRARIGQALLRRSQAEPGNTALRPSLTENPLKIHTISQFPEAVPESTHASLYEVIYQDGNLLKWRKGKN